MEGTVSTVEYAVSIEVEVSPPSERIEVLLEDLTDLLEHVGGAVGATLAPVPAVDVTLTLAADRIGEAEDLAEHLVAEMLGKVGLQVLGVVRREAMTVQVQDRLLERPLIPELVGVSEVASLLGVSKQRLSELRTRADFPQPIVMLAAGPVWARPSLNHFIAGWSRKPGRPRKPAEAAV